MKKIIISLYVGNLLYITFETKKYKTYAEQLD